MMIKKLKNMDGFDIFIVGILSLFGITALLLVVALPIYTVASYQNKEVHQGTITDKYNKRQDKEDKFYIVLDDKQVIENSDLFFKGKFDSADIQARLKVGDKVKVKTIGYRIHFLNLYPVLYEVKKVDKQ
ncbi:phage protein [Staphylococcus aureus]|nr:phage protein [Staphylococcus aureus]